MSNFSPEYEFGSLFNQVRGGFGNLASNNPFLSQSPLTTYQWKYANRSTKDIEGLFFPTAKRYYFGGGNYFALEPDCNCDINPQDFTVYLDKNNQPGYQVGTSDEYLFKVRLYVSKDGLKLQQAHQECLPADDEVLLFLEDNTNDWSSQKLYATFGNKVRKDLLLTIKTNSSLYAALFKVPNFSMEILAELVEKGFVEKPYEFLKGLIVGVVDFVGYLSTFTNWIGQLCDGIGQGILDYLSLPESVWNSDNDDYFLRRENLINALSVSPQKSGMLTTLLRATVIPTSLSSAGGGQTDRLIESLLRSAEMYINAYNQLVASVINELYVQFEGIVVNVKPYITETIAFLSGIWNGLVDFLGGTLKFIGFILSAPASFSNNFEKNLELFDNFCEAISNFNFNDFWEEAKKAYQNIKDYFKQEGSEDLNSDKVAYVVGFGIASIATLFIPFTQLTKLANVSKVGKAFLPTKYLDEIGVAVGKIYKATNNSADDIYKVVNEMLSLLSKGREGIATFFDDLWKVIAEWLIKTNRRVDELIGWKLSQETAEILANSSLLVRQRTQQLIGSTGGMIVSKFSVEYKGVVIFEGSTNEVEAFAKQLKGMTSTEKTAHLERLLNLKITPQLINNGRKWACTNKAGTPLEWSNQKDLNGILRNESVIQSYLKTLKESNGRAKQWVGEVAEQLHKKGELTNINNIIKDAKTNKELGDIDVANANFWIECKESLAKGTLESKNIKTGKFLIIEQFEKYTDPKLSYYLNIENKRVVLAVDKLGAEIDHPVLEELRKMNVTIVTNLNQIKNL